MQSNKNTTPIRRKKRRKIKYKNVSIALILLIILLYAMVSCTMSVVNKITDDNPKSSSTSKPKDESSKNSSENTSTTSDDGKEVSASKPDENNKIPPDQVLNNSAFIGDSRMKGLVLYNNLTTVRDYTDIGLNVETAMSKAFIPTPSGTPVTIQQALSTAGEIERIYISLGINELGWPSVDGFISKYTELVSMVKQTQPKAKIYVLSILPVTKERSDSDAVFNNTKINQVNERIKKMASDLGVTYLDCKPSVADKDGNLPPDSSTDGIHLTKAYCEKWLEYIKNNP